MNKIIKVILFTTGILFAFLLKTSGVSAATLNYSSSGIYYDVRIDGASRLSWWTNLYEIDGKVAYCIQPNTTEGVTYNEGSWNDTGLSNDIKEQLILTAYYGYTYPGHQTLNYRLATQGLIWNLIWGNGAKTVFSTGIHSSGTMLDLSAEEAEIQRLVASHYTRPSFNGGVYRVQVGEELTLTDTNGVLSNYDVIVSGADYSVNGNTLTIKPTSSGTINITLDKKMPYEDAYKFFVGNEIQNVMIPGTTDPVIAGIRVNSYYGSVEINKKDSETRTSTPQGQATLEGAKYGVYDTSGNLITTITTNSSGYGKSDAVLEYKDYYIQEISHSLGYYTDNTRYSLNMRSSENKSIDVYETVVKNNINILKQYNYVDGNSTFLNAEANIIFDIYYPDGRSYGSVRTNSSGYASITLPYGIWKFSQRNTTTGYQKIYNFYITVDYDSELNQEYNILNNAISAYLRVIKVDADTGKSIAIADTTFKIYDLDNNEYVSQYVGGKVYSEFKTDENGIMDTYLKLRSGHYKLVEIKNPNKYVLDTDGLEFTIGDNTHYSYTTYGPYITLYFENTPIKGQIEIIKKGEVFNIEDGTFNYDSTTPLENVVFEIFADEDIMSPDGQYVYYSKGDKVDTITTDSLGYAISKELTLGKYVVYEKSNENSDYLLDEEVYNVELTEKDNRTRLVYSKLELLNILKKGKLEFTKTDLINGEGIPNTVIEVYTEDDQLVFTGITDEEGNITIDNLKAGEKYYIIEKVANSNYVITDKIVYFEIKENGEVVKAEMKNKPILGKLEFSKVDLSTGEPVPGALIEIYNADTDELVFSGITSEDGKITIEMLRKGRYYILEKEAPEKYNLNPDRMYFEIKEDEEIVKSTMTDERIPEPDIPVIEVPDTEITEKNHKEVLCLLLIFIGFGALIYAIKERKK